MIPGQGSKMPHATQCSQKERRKESSGTYTHRKYYSAIKKEILPFAIPWSTCLEDIILSDISQTWKHKYHVLFTCEIKKKSNAQKQKPGARGKFDCRI